MHGAPSGLTPDLAERLLRLRNLRLQNVAQAAVAARRQTMATEQAAWEAEQHAASHCATWQDAEASHARKLTEQIVAAHALQSTRTRLDVMADEAARLNDTLREKERDLHDALRKQREALTLSTVTEQRRNQAQDLLNHALLARETERDAMEEHEQEDLTLARSCLSRPGMNGS
ncbi:hypothetical protein J2D73_11660 [Acetobacter sacchari]|uniref:Type III secretion protein n=1 Tax=Acetobacter sacchari TaxID=2661687 RepID=A0ABS3LX13_9PROT|nr:hypothetical protein [Acetobacter sacchari]MBO1360444.1 hypothetical protein [Acetobacter sacchari]